MGKKGKLAHFIKSTLVIKQKKFILKIFIILVRKLREGGEKDTKNCNN